VRFVGVRVGVTHCWNKLELRRNFRNLHAIPRSQRSSYTTRETVPLMEFINKYLNSISAMFPLPSATLPLPLFKILPLPFPLTSRAALDRPAKKNNPIVKLTQASVRGPNSFVWSPQYCVISLDHIEFRFSIKLHRSA